jgi:hypothetical protein
MLQQVQSLNQAVETVNHFTVLLPEVNGSEAS